MSTLRVTAGTLRGRRVPVPPRVVRPTSERARQAYFNIVGERIDGARFLDLFAGSGIFSFEAVSRGATTSVAVEHDRKSAATIERLAAEWNAAVTVVARDVFTSIPRLAQRFELVYADPPYDLDRYDELLDLVPTVISDDALVAIEHRAGAGFTPPASLQAVDSRSYGDVSITFFGR